MTNQKNQNQIEEGTIYVLFDKRDNKTLKGYFSEGVFRYWEVQPINWEPIENAKDFYAEEDKILERVNNGGLKQLN